MASKKTGNNKLDRLNEEIDKLIAERDAIKKEENLQKEGEKLKKYNDGLVELWFVTRAYIEDGDETTMPDLKRVLGKKKENPHNYIWNEQSWPYDIKMPDRVGLCYQSATLGWDLFKTKKEAVEVLESDVSYYEIESARMRTELERLKNE